MLLQTTAQTALSCLTSVLQVSDENENEARRIRLTFGFLLRYRWRSWLRHCALSRKVAGSIPDGVIDIPLPAALWPWG
jgi:hypothetical protein